MLRAMAAAPLRHTARQQTPVTAQTMLLIRLPATDFARITRSILQTATVALIIIQISSARPAHLLRPTGRRTVIVSHIHSHKARTVLFSEERSRYRLS